MRYYPSEPDIATLMNRIWMGDIDLQPDFQRGDVWPLSKKQRLIDTILRSWIVPPVILVSSNERLQILDGQQRLASIRDFCGNEFSIDGNQEPKNQHIKSLDGKFYKDLPEQVKKAFDRTPIRMYEITDYSSDEPAEVFFRLNQPTALTSAERRNAIFGKVRHQIRALAERLIAHPLIPEALGFNNSRMAYDDVLARVAFTLHVGSLRKKISDQGVNELYRSPYPLSKAVEERLDSSLESLIKSLEDYYRHPNTQKFKLNKATLYSWLIFLSRIPSNAENQAQFFLPRFESQRLKSASYEDSHSSPRPDPILSVYADRATSRVSDVNSVILRDLALALAWRGFDEFDKGLFNEPGYRNLSSLFVDLQNSDSDPELLMLDFATCNEWGAHI